MKHILIYQRKKRETVSSREPSKDPVGLFLGIMKGRVCVFIQMEKIIHLARKELDSANPSSGNVQQYVN